MNKFQEAIKDLENGIKLYVNKMIEKSPKDMTYSAIIYSGGIEGYNIKLNGKIYENVPTIGGVCTVNETVKVLIPQNNYNNMIILKATNGSSDNKNIDNEINFNTLNNEIGNVQWIMSIDTTDTTTKEINMSLYRGIIVGLTYNNFTKYETYLKGLLEENDNKVIKTEPENNYYCIARFKTTASTIKIINVIKHLDTVPTIINVYGLK